MNETEKTVIEEMAHDLCGRCQDGICVVDGRPCNLDLDCTCQINATTLYDAGYRKQSELTPCDLCKFNPPSSGDGKPCFMCPAQRFEEGESKL